MLINHRADAQSVRQNALFWPQESVIDILGFGSYKVLFSICVAYWEVHQQHTA